MSRKALPALVTSLFSLILFLSGVQSAHAIPILQLYLEGGVYNTDTESWELTPSGSSGGAPFRLWTIGNVSGPGGKGTIEAVRLSVAYDSSFSITVTLTPSTTGGFGGFTDPSTPGAPTIPSPIMTSLGDVLASEVTNGGSPVLGSGNNLPSHGIYGDGTSWQEFLLGDFTSSDSPMGDFIGGFPTDLTDDAGQINVYEVSITGGSGATVHFDLYNHVEGANHASFAPFSHDADADVNIIPEPSSIVVWMLLGLIGLVTSAHFQRPHRS